MSEGRGVFGPRERGQATVEYVLMLLVGLMTFSMVVRGTLAPAFERFQDQLTERVNSTFFPGGQAGGALHQLRLSR